MTDDNEVRAAELLDWLLSPLSGHEWMSMMTAALSAAEARGHVAGFRAGAEVALRHVGIMDYREASDDIDARIAALTSKERTP